VLSTVPLFVLMHSVKNNTKVGEISLFLLRHSDWNFLSTVLRLCLNFNTCWRFVVCTLAKNLVDLVDAQVNRGLMNFPLVIMLCHLSC
jgi:hypothetical protein